MSTRLEWLHMRLDQMCERVTAEAAAKADRIILDMSTHDELPYWDQIRNGFAQTHYRYSVWETHRILVPRLLADLDALVVAS